MAGKAAKKQSQQNIKILNDLYKVTIPIVSLSLLRSIISKTPDTSLLRVLINFLLLHSVPFVSIYIIESLGRPKYGPVDSYGQKRPLISEGQDLSAQDNLFQYLFDVIYLSLFGDIGKILFNTTKFWYVFLACPVYVVYKVYSLKRQYFGSTSSDDKASDDKASEGAGTKSKRQMKLEKRGKTQVKYR